MKTPCKKHALYWSIAGQERAFSGHTKPGGCLPKPHLLCLSLACQLLQLLFFLLNQSPPGPHLLLQGVQVALLTLQAGPHLPQDLGSLLRLALSQQPTPS